MEQRRQTLITHPNGTTVVTNAHVHHSRVPPEKPTRANSSDISSITEEGEPPMPVAEPLGLGTRDSLSEPFDVPIGGKADVDALAAFLKRGGVSNLDDWDSDALPQLGYELCNGEATLGLDCGGMAKRVVSVAKPVLFDGEHLLVEAFQYFPTKKKVKVKCSGMSEKFSRAKETYYEASARAVVEELKLDIRCVNPALLSRHDKSVGPFSQINLLVGWAKPASGLRTSGRVSS